ncbi:DUF2993 domain-containing protein [Streptomyces sp. NPDC020667]|uniref:LmeA family phospholipid-binding protein n=1 Tax=Streptomyces sp. NPDC020667 TaxID=3154895 RepID=UPI0033CCBB3F
MTGIHPKVHAALPRFYDALTELTCVSGARAWWDKAMRTPIRMQPRPRNPYDELAALADPDPLLGEVTQEMPIPEGVPGDCPTSAQTVLPLRIERDEPWSPPDHRRAGKGRRAKRSRRRRRGPFAAVPRALKLLFALLVCTGFLVLADRCAAMYAEKKAQRTLQDQLHLVAAPQVDIHGFPFLTQVLDKRLERVDVTVPHVAADRVSLAKVRASAHDIRLTGDLPSDIRGAVVGNLDGEVVMSFDDMNRELAASQVKFSRRDENSVSADGKLVIAGQELRVRAEAQLRLVDNRELSTDVDGMSLDVPGIATYRPGRGRGLTLHRETAERISRDAARVKALLSVPAVVERLGVPTDVVAEALRDEEKLHELTGAPKFVEQLTHVNLVDVVVDRPWLLSKIGIDPKLINGLIHMRPPELSDRLSFSFSLPKEARLLQLRGVKVEKDGIRVSLSGMELAVGKNG